MEWKNALKILKNAIKVFPTLVRVIGEIETAVKQAQDPQSPGGKKMSPMELASITAKSISSITEAIIDLFDEQKKV